jgi:Chalcone isomerase-like
MHPTPPAHPEPHHAKGPRRRQTGLRRGVAQALASVLAGAAVGAWPGVVAAQAPQAASQVQYQGQAFDKTVQLAGVPLRLNGLGVRQVAWFKGYLVALYLPQEARTAAQVQALAGPKRLQLRILHEVPAVEFSKAVRKGIGRNATPEQAAALQARTDRLVQSIDALGKVRKDDVVNLDFAPGQGLTLSVNGTPRGEPMAGDDFYAALLRSFVGDVPYDDKMRDGLLGKP